jgi:hypothetical protein
MPRAGSGWYYNLTHDLVTASGGQNARQVRKRYHLQKILTEVNCNIGALTVRRLSAVLIPSLLGNTFVIKAHAGPTPFAMSLIRAGWLRSAYIYRDPRDAMLSAFDNGQKALQKGRPNAFSHLVNFETSVTFMQDYVSISEAWLSCNQALHTRYESLVGDYDREADRLVNFLGLNRQSSAIQAVIDRYRPEQARPDQKGLHFNKGIAGRFRKKMSLEQQQVLMETFGDYLQRLGYEP